MLLPFCGRDGRPQEKAVAQPHRQAPRAAPHRAAGAERLPAVPQPAPSAPGVPRVRPLRRPRGRRAGQRARPRPRARRTSNGRAGRARSSPSTATAPTSGPAEVAAGAAIAAAEGARVLLFGPGGRAGRGAGRRRGGRRPGLDRQGAGPGGGRAHQRATPRSCSAAKAVAEGRAAGARVRRRDRRRARGRDRSTSSATAASTVPRSRCRCRCPGTRSRCSTSARTPRPGASTSSSSRSWARRSPSIVLGVPRPRVGLLSNGEEDARGSALVVEAGVELRIARATTSAGQRSRLERRPTPRCPLRVRRQRRGRRPRHRQGRRGRHRRLHRQRRSEGARGHLAGAAAARSATPPRPRARAKAGGLLLQRRARGGCARRSIPKPSGGAYLLGLRRLGVVPHGRFSRAGFAQAILRARLGAREDIVGQTHAALAEAGALRRSPASAPDASLRR